MQELRFVAVSEDGSYAVLAVPGRSGRYILPIDERLRAVALGQTSRLAQYEIEVESPLRPKEIQARIRAGETAEEIADAAGIPVERVRWFEGPVLAERAYIADQAQSGSVRRAGDAAGPGPRLGDIVTERLNAAGTDPADGQWDSRKRGDGNWQVSLTFPSGGRLHVAEWVFDPRRRHVMPDDDNAARLSLPESELPAAPVPVPGEATVTPIASRLAPAAGMGGAPMPGGFPGAARFRPDKSVIPDRSLGVDRSLVERPATMPDRAAAGLSDRAPLPTPAAPAPPRNGQHGSGQHERPARPGYVEFPESAPYRAPEPSAEPPTYRDYDYQDPRPAYREPVGFRTPAPEPSAYRDYDYQDPGPAYREPQPEAAAHRTLTDAPARESDAPARGMVDSGMVAPPRRVVFEDPEPAFFDEDLGPATELAPAVAPAAPAAPAPAPVQAESTVQPEDTASHSAAQPEAAVTQIEEPAAATEAVEPVTEVEPTVPEATAPAVAAEPAAAAAPETAAATVEPPVAEATGPTAELEPKAETADPAEEPPTNRRGAKKNPKARRSSVPSWDEIMLGSSRQRD